MVRTCIAFRAMQSVSADDSSVAPCSTSDDLLTVEGAATALRVSRRTVYRMVDDGLLELVHVPSPSGRRQMSRIRRSDVERRLAVAS